LETVGSRFVAGYNLALEYGTPEVVGENLGAIEPELRGFAFEGAAMGLALLDCVTPWRSNRVAVFLRGAGNDHIYMVHVGVGWLWARMPASMRPGEAHLDPLLRWLAFDGWGFHEGFFRWPEYIAGQPHPKKLKGYETRAFDQGLGRSFWFVNGADVDLIARVISDFGIERQPDLWSGIGLAAAYAGIVDEACLSRLRKKAGAFWPHVAQGAAFAAKARHRAGNVTEYTELAARTLCDLSAEEAAHLTDLTVKNLAPAVPQAACDQRAHEKPLYEIWRRRLQNHFHDSRQLQAA
jgi:hypothetical protein